jgi:hypothetical protein
MTTPPTAPGTERSERRPEWPEQLRLPGQTAAPDGPVDLHAMFVMHHAFRRDLVAFAAAAEATPATDRETWRRLQRRWELFSTVLHHHHSGEDAGLWPVLLERSDEAGRATLEAMEAEHAEIDPLLAGCADGFDRMAQAADDDARRALAVRLVATRERLAQHLRHEETEALVLVQQHLTEQEWRDLEQEHFRSDLSPKELFTLVSWAAYGIGDQQRREVLEKTGLPFVVLWRLGRGRFARSERRTFRYVTTG